MESVGRKMSTVFDEETNELALEVLKRASKDIKDFPPNMRSASLNKRILELMAFVQSVRKDMGKEKENIFSNLGNSIEE